MLALVVKLNFNWYFLLSYTHGSFIDFQNFNPSDINYGQTDKKFTHTIMLI